MARKKIKKVSGNRKANIVLNKQMGFLVGTFTEFTTITALFIEEVLDRRPKDDEHCTMCNREIGEQHKEDCIFETAAELEIAAEKTFQLLGVKS